MGLHAILAIASRTGVAISVARTAGGATFQVTIVASPGVGVVLGPTVGAGRKFLAMLAKS